MRLKKKVAQYESRLKKGNLIEGTETFKSLVKDLETDFTKEEIRQLCEFEGEIDTFVVDLEKEISLEWSAESVIEKSVFSGLKMTVKPFDAQLKITIIPVGSEEDKEFSVPVKINKVTTEVQSSDLHVRVSRGHFLFDLVPSTIMLLSPTQAEVQFSTGE